MCIHMHDRDIFYCERTKEIEITQPRHRRGFCRKNDDLGEKTAVKE